MASPRGAAPSASPPASLLGEGEAPPPAAGPASPPPAPALASAPPQPQLQQSPPPCGAGSPPPASPTPPPAAAASPPGSLRRASADGGGDDAASRGSAGAAAVPAALRRSFNTARAPQPLDTLSAASAVAAALQAQFGGSSGGGGGGEGVDSGCGGEEGADSVRGGARGAAAAAMAAAYHAPRPIHERVALLAERHCEKLMARRARARACGRRRGQPAPRAPSACGAPQRALPTAHTRPQPTYPIAHPPPAQDITGELGEPTAPRRGCMTGALTCLHGRQRAARGRPRPRAAPRRAPRPARRVPPSSHRARKRPPPPTPSFRHVLGVEWDAQMVLAAKELKERGDLEYTAAGPGGGEVRVPAPRAPAARAPRGAGAPPRARAPRPPPARPRRCLHARRRAPRAARRRRRQVRLTARVPDGIDRDRVRFWHCPGLPDLPPKLAPVDALVVEDGAGRLARGRARLLDQVPGVLNPRGVCVVALPARGGAGCGGGGQEGDALLANEVEAAKGRMAALGLELVAEEAWPPAGTGGGGGGGGAVLLVWKKPGV